MNNYKHKFKINKILDKIVKYNIIKKYLILII